MQEVIKKAKAGRKHLDFLDVLLTARVSLNVIFQYHILKCLLELRMKRELV